MSDRNSAEPPETSRDSTLPGMNVRGFVRDALDGLLEELTEEVRETTAAVRRHKSDPPEAAPDTQPSGRPGRSLH